MDTGSLIHGLLLFVAFIAFVTLHEFAHAWTAVKCGDDTPRLQGRLTIDPIAHIDIIGTIALPLLAVVVGAFAGQSLIFGWGRPVMVNLDNFRRRQLDDILVSGAGPAMNVLIAVALLVLIKAMEGFVDREYLDAVLNLARFSLFLCFFNLLPIPPLDGGHIMRNLIGMSDETYRMLSQYSFMALLLVMQSPQVGKFVVLVTDSALELLARPFGWTISIG